MSRIQIERPTYEPIDPIEGENIVGPSYTTIMAPQANNAQQMTDAARQLESAIQTDPENAALYLQLGKIRYQGSNIQQALDCFRTATIKDPGLVEAWLLLGISQRRCGLNPEAINSYEKAVEIQPDFNDARYNLGLVYAANGRNADAAEQYKAVLDRAPDYVDAWFGLGVCTGKLGDLEKALHYYEQGLKLAPNHAGILNNLGYICLAMDRLDDSLEAFRKSASLKYNHGIPVPGPGQMFLHRIRHDAEQTNYLLKKNIINKDDYQDYLDAFTGLENCYAHLTGDRQVDVDAMSMKRLTPSFSRIIHYADCPAMPDGSLNPELDWPAHEETYLNSSPEVVVIDGLLRPEALKTLHDYCLESTVWKTVRPYGYMGALLGDGFASPLLLQIIQELKEKLPRILGTHNLVQAWAYKYDNTLNTINIHADCAAVNLNFWITPDSANKNPENGGLIFWDKLPPEDWGLMRTQNPDKTEIKEFLKSSGARETKVPYKQNRVVLFNSALFHKSDNSEFIDGYENRRINVTLLYGKGLS